MVSDFNDAYLGTYEAAGYTNADKVEIIIGYDDIRKVDEGVSCEITE